MTVEQDGQAATDAQDEETEHWIRYYAATVERPAWETVRKAIELFAAEDGAAATPAAATPAGAEDAAATPAASPAAATTAPATAPGAEATAASPATAAGGRPAAPARFAVDLGCGAGRDTRELLRNGWRVLAMDRQPQALASLEEAVAPEPALSARLSTVLADFDAFEIPPCDLVNASLCLPYIVGPVFDTAWARIVAALPAGGRFAAMVFGDRDEAAGEEGVTCLPPETYRQLLEGFEIEHWSDTEEDRPTVEGGSHHYHLIQFVARKAS